MKKANKDLLRKMTKEELIAEIDKGVAVEDIEMSAQDISEGFKQIVGEEVDVDAEKVEELLKLAKSTASKEIRDAGESLKDCVNAVFNNFNPKGITIYDLAAIRKETVGHHLDSCLKRKVEPQEVAAIMSFISLEFKILQRIAENNLEQHEEVMTDIAKAMKSNAMELIEQATQLKMLTMIKNGILEDVAELEKESKVKSRRSRAKSTMTRVDATNSKYKH